MCISGSCKSDGSVYRSRTCLSSGVAHLSFTLCFHYTVVRNRVKYAQFRNKRMNTNPGKGPFHFQESGTHGVANHSRNGPPQDGSWRKRLSRRLSTFEGIPAPYDKQKRVVVPAALRVMRLKPDVDYCRHRRSCSFGWLEAP